MSTPPAWGYTPRLLNGELPEVTYLTTESRRVGTDFPYGCGWCARSLQRDELEFCEHLMRTVHAECHEVQCTSPQCGPMLCTEDRCDRREECDGCFEEFCRRHGVTDCLC